MRLPLRESRRKPQDEPGFKSWTDVAADDLGDEDFSDEETGNGKRSRGSYNCGKCGVPKRGHVCPYKEKSGKAAGKASMGSKRGQGGKGPARAAKTPVKEEREDAVRERVPLKRRLALHGAGSPVTPSMSLEKRQGQLSLRRRTDPSPSETPVSAVPEESQEYVEPEPLKRSSPAQQLSALMPPPRPSPAATRTPVKLAPFIVKHSRSSQCWLKIMTMLDAQSLAVVACVSREFSALASSVWAATTEATLVLRSSPHPVYMLAGIMSKCTALEKLVLSATIDIGDDVLEVLSCEAKSLRELSVVFAGTARNAFSEAGVQELVEELPDLRSLTIEGCSALEGLTFASCSLAELRISGCTSVSRFAVKCPTLRQLSLDLLPGAAPASASAAALEVPSGSGRSDGLMSVMRQIAEACPSLWLLELCSAQLTDMAIAALLSNDPRSLRALRLRHAPRLSDASIRTIAARCTDLELLDLSGCGGLTDRALDAISGAFHGTLQRVLIACCPQISRAGVERMAADLPLLTLLDCSFSLALPPAPEQRAGGKVFRAGSASPLRHTAAPAAQRSPPPLFGPEAVRVERSSRVLIRGDGIPHSPAGTLELGCPRLRKLSLFGCTRIQGVVLDTFELEELNITNCSRLKGSALDISKCCHLQRLHMAGCPQGVQASALEALASMEVDLSRPSVPCVYWR